MVSNMKNIAITALIGLGISSSSAFALPCAERYSSYGEKLINEKYQIVTLDIPFDQNPKKEEFFPIFHMPDNYA